MIKIFTKLCLFFITFNILGQQKAVTESGDEIFVYDNGTWEFVDSEIQKELFIPTNDKEFKKDKNSDFLLRSKNIKMGFWINPKKWTFKKASTNAEAEYQLKFKEGDLYGMVIAEEIEVPLVNLKDLAVENARQVAPDIKIVKEEYRVVNGLKVLMLEMNGTMQGIKFAYFSYYYSSPKGSLQFITYTSQGLLKKYKSDCENLLSGIVDINE